MRRICLIIHSILGVLILLIIVKLCNPGISSWVHILVVYPHLRSKVHLIHVHQAQFVYTMYHKCTLSNISPQFIIVFSHTLVSNLLRIHPVYSFWLIALYHTVIITRHTLQQIVLWYLMLTLSLNPIITRLHVLQSASVWLTAVIDHSCIINTLWNTNIACWLFGIS